MQLLCKFFAGNKTRAQYVEMWHYFVYMFVIGQQAPNMLEWKNGYSVFASDL